ncbi:LysE family translocator [Rhodobacteraceae bacterium NNCM2]|nr:LysE family translocator [Coraliihabitans acroporae]
MSALILGWLTMFIAAASPGPSTFAIMGTSLAHGRPAGMRFATGVCAGSVFWGIVSATGIGFLLQLGWALLVLKVLGAGYLIWLAYKAARAAAAPDSAAPEVPARGFFAAGLALHLTNPKAVFGWGATVAIGLPQGSGPSEIVLFLAGCAVLAVIINLGYALAFSTAPVVRAYRRVRRWIQGTFAALFAAAGIGLLAWRP